MALARMASAGRRPPFDCITEKRPRKPRSVEPLPEALDVPVNHGLNVGRQRRRRGALVFAKLARDVGGDGDVQIRQRLGQQVAQRPLVRRVDVGIEKADGDRLVGAGSQRRHQSARPTSATSSGVAIVPSARMRSATSKLADRVTTGLGFWYSRS